MCSLPHHTPLPPSSMCYPCHRMPSTVLPSTTTPKRSTRPSPPSRTAVRPISPRTTPFRTPSQPCKPRQPASTATGPTARRQTPQAGATVSSGPPPAVGPCPTERHSKTRSAPAAACNTTPTHILSLRINRQQRPLPKAASQAHRKLAACFYSRPSNRHRIPFKLHRLKGS